MPVSKKQFSYLKEMGIDVWQKNNQTNSLEPASNAYPVDSQALIKAQLFSDILTAMNFTVADVSFGEKNIGLPNLRWQFTNTDKIIRNGSSMETPPVDIIAKDPILKAQLWAQIQNA